MPGNDGLPQVRDIGWQALGPAIACTALASLVVATRWYARLHLVRCVGWDDYVILLSLVRFSSCTTRELSS